MAQLNFPDSPVSGTTYAAPNGITYTFDTSVGAGVWKAAVSTPLAVTAGSIAGTAAVGATLTYTKGTYSGGTPPVTESWIWKRESNNTTLQTGGLTYVILSTLVGDRVYVAYTATDSVLQTATGNTTNYPTFPSTIATSPVTGAVSPTSIPGVANFTWANGSSNLTGTGCIEFSKNSGPFTQASTPVVNGDVITTQWLDNAGSGLCGDAPDGTIITGSLTNGTLTSTFNLTVDKVPNAFTLSPATETVNAGVVTTANPSFTLSGSNSPSYIWGSVAPTGTSPQYTTDNGTTWVSLPSSPGTAYVDPGQTVKVRFTTATPSSTETLTVNVGASVASKQSGTFAVTVTTAGVTGAVAPTTIPGVESFTWADAPGTLTATGCIEFSVDAGANWVVSAPVTNAPATAVQTRWVNNSSSGLCGDSAGNATITGSLTAGLATSNFSLVMNRTPSAFTLSPNTDSTTPNTVTTADPSFSVDGTNSPSLIWGSFGTTGGTPQYSVNGGGTWASIPAAPGTATVNPGNVVSIRFTTGASLGSEVYTVNVGASATAGQFQSGAFTVTVVAAPFPSTTFSPAAAPNASPASVNSSPLFGTASATWSDGATSLTSSGGIVFQVNGGGYGSGPTSVTNSDTLDVIWDPATVAAAANGQVLSGAFTNGVNTNNYTLTVNKVPTGLAFTDLSSQSLSTAVTSDVITPAGFNVPVTYTFAGTSTNPLTSPGVSVQGGAFNTSPQTVNPGQTLQMQGTTGAGTGIVYGVDITMGSGSSPTTTWTAATSAVAPTVNTPSITAPINGATALNPALNTPGGLTVTSTAFASSGGAGTNHVSSDWQLATDAAFTTVVFSATASTTSLVSWLIPQANLTVSTTYYVRVRYTSGTTGPGVATTSSYSAGSSFATASSFAPAIGTAMEGGYFAGQIQVFAGEDGGGLPTVTTIYNLIVAPKPSGQYSSAGGVNDYGSSVRRPSLYNNLVYGGTATAETGANNTTTCKIMLWAYGLVIGGYSDWYCPASREMSILYTNLKPTTGANLTSTGTNPNAVPPKITNYTTTVPGQTSSALFKTGGAQAFLTDDTYWTATQTTGASASAFMLNFLTGAVTSTQSDTPHRGCAIRRVLA